MSEKEQDKPSGDKRNLRQKLTCQKSSMKATKDKSKTKLDKPYETDEPVGGASCSHMIDRAYDSDIVEGPIRTGLPPVPTLRAELIEVLGLKPATRPNQGHASSKSFSTNVLQW